MSQDNAPSILSYAGLIRFGKDKSKIKLSPKELIILILIFAILFAALDFIIGNFF